MREGWTRAPLGELLTLEYGKGLPEAKRHGGAFPVIGSAGIVGSHSEPLVSPGPVIVVGRKGTAGAVHWSDTPCWPIDTTYYAVPGLRVTPRYAWLALQAANLPSICAQTGVPGLNRDRAYEIEVPLPPIAEQRRIVDLIRAVDAAAEPCRAAIESARAAFRSMRDTRIARHWSARLQPLGAVLERTRRPLPVTQAGRYSEIGIRSHGKGIFHKPPVLGQSLGSKAVFGIEPGDLVFNIVFAWEGAVAVASPSEAGRCGSHRFPTYLARPDVNVNYVQHVLLSPRGLALLGLASPGSAGRNRTLNQSSLMRSPIPVPRLDEQERFVRDLDGIEAVTAAHAGNLRALDRLRDALLADLLAGDHEIPVSYDRFLDGAA
jgi:type I restriction enzyme S subunit